MDEKELINALVRSMIILIAIDSEIVRDEQHHLLKSIKKIWKKEYGSFNIALEEAVKEIIFWHKMGDDLMKQAEKNAVILAEGLSFKEKKGIWKILSDLIKADGIAKEEEITLYSLLKEKMNVDKRILSSVKKEIGTFFNIECRSCHSTKTKKISTGKFECEECGYISKI